MLPPARDCHKASAFGGGGGTDSRLGARAPARAQLGQSAGRAAGIPAARRAAPLALRSAMAGGGLDAGRPGGGCLGVARTLLADHPGDTCWNSPWQAEFRAGQGGGVRSAVSKLCLSAWPPAGQVALTYADSLAQRDERDAGTRAQAVLRPLAGMAGDRTGVPAHLRPCQRNRRRPGARGRGLCRAAYLNGLRWGGGAGSGAAEHVAQAHGPRLLRPGPDDARIAAITPTVLELKRQGIRDPDLRRR